MRDTLTVSESVKMGGAEFPIRLVADEDIKHTDQDGVGDGDNRALLPPACGQPAEARRQIGPLGRWCISLGDGPRESIGMSAGECQGSTQLIHYHGPFPATPPPRVSMAGRYSLGPRM